MTQNNKTTSSQTMAREYADWAYERTFFALLRMG
jgi:hypothetical protein